MHNNRDYPKNIFSRGRGRNIIYINHFKVTSQLILIGGSLNEKKNKIYKIINNICKKIKKIISDIEKRKE